MIFGKSVKERNKESYKNFLIPAADFVNNVVTK
jgi:hypothetical protein